jgi:hypothetical protein
MSVDQRLRTGLHRSADAVEVSDADAVTALRTVRARDRRRSRIRRRIQFGAIPAVAAGLAAAAFLAPHVPWTDPQPQPSDAEPGSVVGVYVVDVAPPANVAGRDLAGRWLVDLKADGTVVLDPPPDYSGMTNGAYVEEPSTLKTDILGDLPGCQQDGQYLGTYQWAQDDDGLSMTALADTCAPRVHLLTAQKWGPLP